MQLQVLVQIAWVPKRSENFQKYIFLKKIEKLPLTNRTFQGFISSMRSRMNLEPILSRVVLATEIALVPLIFYFRPGLKNKLASDKPLQSHTGPYLKFQL